MSLAIRLQEKVNHTNECQNVKPVLLFVDDDRASVHAYLVKPHQPKDLKLIIYKELLERKKNRREIDRIKASQKNSANRARESGASLSKNQRLIEAIQQGSKNLLIIYDPTFESKRERYEFRKDLARGIGNAL